MRENMQSTYDERRLLSAGGQNDRSTTMSNYQLPREREDEERKSKPAVARQTSSANANHNFLTDFFSPEVFQVVLHNPTTAHRFLRFCQSRACGENLEFLHKVEKFHKLLDEVQRTLGDIHSTYTSHNATRQINVPGSIIREISADVKETTQTLLPSLESIFADAQIHIERLLASDVYPRFVKHQITTQATTALAQHRERFQGLGDCFCLTDPAVADNPILYASDGFVAVTGYSRKEIVPRNCRFLQGDLTDSDARRRLRASIVGCEETVELLLNYRKNGDPFWNLLYVSPLFNERGEVSLFLGGQINCSTTIHSCTDVLRILSVNDDELDNVDAIRENKGAPGSRGGDSTKSKSSFFKSYKKYQAQGSGRLKVRDQVGMEQELLNKVGRMNFKTQVEAFYTAYSKYLVMTYNPANSALLVQHYSPGVIDMLCLNLPNGAIIPIYNKDIFKVLGDHSSSSSGTMRSFKETVRVALRTGRAVSVELGLMTGFLERKSSNWFGSEKDGLRRVEERYVTHWTPLKDEEGRTKWVVLTIAPKV